MHTTTKSGRFIGFKHLKKPLSNQRLTKQPNQTSMTPYDKTYRYYKINSEKLPNKKITRRRTNSNNKFWGKGRICFPELSIHVLKYPIFKKLQGIQRNKKVWPIFRKRKDY